MAVETAIAVDSAPTMAVVMVLAVDMAQGMAVDSAPIMAVDTAPIMAVVMGQDMAVDMVPTVAMDMALAIAVTGQSATGIILLVARTLPPKPSEITTHLEIMLIQGFLSHISISKKLHA